MNSVRVSDFNNFDVHLCSHSRLGVKLYAVMYCGKWYYDLSFKTKTGFTKKRFDDFVEALDHYNRSTY